MKQTPLSTEIHETIALFRKMERDWQSWRSRIDKIRKRIERSTGNRMFSANKEQIAIVNRCAKEFGCNPTDLLRRGRMQHIADARHAAMWLLAEVLSMTTWQIASVFRCERSNVSHGIGKVKTLMESDVKFGKRMNQLKKECE